MKRTYYLSLIFIFLFACSKDENTKTEIETEIETKVDFLVSDYQSKSFSPFTINYVTSLITDELSVYDYKPVQGIKMVYNTVDHENKSLEASGYLFIPEGFDVNLPLVSVQHGTISSNDQAPTNSSLGQNEMTFGVVLSSLGAIVAISDYVGYGSSRDHKHPYMHKENLARSSYDFLHAANEYLGREDIKTNGELFLAGYSEGGYATMALHQLIEKENKFKVTHSLPGAGAYDLTAFSKEIFAKDEELPFMSTYVWVLEVYNELFESLKNPLDTYFNEPYASNLSNLNEINAPIDSTLINFNPQILFKKEIIDEVVNGEDSALTKVIALNNTHDWKPEAEITLFHGTADSFVFPLNSLSALDKIKAKGGEVNYVELEGKTHETAIIPYFLEVINIIIDKN